MIINLVNHKVYIGSSARCLKDRGFYHQKLLRKNKHHSIYLQRAFNKYGEDNFEFFILDCVEPEFCVSTEQWWINMMQSADKRYGYNMCPKAGSSLGRKLERPQKPKAPMSDYTRKLLSDSQKGVPKSKEHAAKVGRKQWMAISQYDLEGNFIRHWDSVTEAQRVPGISNITKSLHNIRPHASGYIWKFKT